MPRAPMTPSDTDRIEKRITLKAPRSRVWRALTDSKEFGEWFRVRLEGPFRVGESIRGQVTYPGHEHMVLRAEVVAIEPETRFAFRWCPYAIDPGKDFSGEPTTLVEFLLEDLGGGTLLTVVESGFDSIPPEHRDECFRRNENGWEVQVENIRAHVDG